MALCSMFATRLGAVAFFRIHRTLLGYPRAGVHVGGGRHVEMPEVDPGLVGNALGWTVRHRRMRRRLADSVYGWVLDDVFQAAATDPTARSRLTALQRNTLDNALAAALDDPTFDVPTLYVEEDTE